MRQFTFRLAGVIMLLASLGLTLAACGSTAASKAADPVNVRLGYYPNITHAVALVGVQRGTFQAAFTALRPHITLTPTTFNAGPAEAEALLAGDLDIGYIGPNPAINAYVKSHGEALRIIAGAASGGAQLIVRPEAHISVPADLAGKKIADPQQGGTQDIALRYYLKQHGLKTTEEGGTVQVVPTDNASILTLFQQGKIDGAWVPEPWASRLLLDGHGQLFVDEATLWPGGKFVTTVVIVATPFLKQHPDVVAAFLKGHVAAVRYVNANPDAAGTIANAEIGRITGKTLPDTTIKHAFANVQSTYDPLITPLLVSADHAYALGFLGETKPNLSTLFDIQPLQAVLKGEGLPPVSGT